MIQAYRSKALENKYFRGVPTKLNIIVVTMQTYKETIRIKFNDITRLNSQTRRSKIARQLTLSLPLVSALSIGYFEATMGYVRRISHFGEVETSHWLGCINDIIERKCFISYFYQEEQLIKPTIECLVKNGHTQ